MGIASHLRFRRDLHSLAFFAAALLIGFPVADTPQMDGATSPRRVTMSDGKENGITRVLKPAHALFAAPLNRERRLQLRKLGKQ